MSYDPNTTPTNSIVDTAGLAYLVSVQAQLPLAMYIVNQQTGSTYTTERVAGVMTVVQTGGPGTVVVPPTSPVLYVASTGSDAITQPGTQALPLATPQEAARRLGASGWLVEAFVITLDTVSLGASPNLMIPPPTGGAKPICFRTTTAVDLTLACTGGTQGSFAVPVTGSTFTTGVGMVANAHRGKILSVTAGPGGLFGTWQIIHANDVAGVFTVPFRTAAAPAVGNTFDVLSRTGKWTWTGDFHMTSPGGVVLDGMEMLPTTAFSSVNFVGGFVQENAVRWLTVAAVSFVGREVAWISGPLGGTGFGGYTPTGTISCGCRYDGAAGLISLWLGAWNLQATYASGSFENFNLAPAASALQTCGVTFMGNSILNNTGIFLTRTATLILSIVLFEAGRGAPSGNSVLRFRSVGNDIDTVTFGTAVLPTAANVDLVFLERGATTSARNCDGSATTAGKLALNVQDGGCVSGIANLLMTGGTVGQDVSVDSGTAFPIADAVTMGVVGSQNGDFQHSSSSLGASPVTINKFSGFAAVAVGANAVVINNSLADVGDMVHLTPITINPTVAKWSAVATLNTITVTTDANATVAAWAFNFELVKATV